MFHKLKKYVLWLPVALLLGGLAFGSLQLPNPPRSAATIQYRIYTLKANGEAVEDGTKTYYLSANGSARMVQKTVSGRIAMLTVADASRGGLFILGEGKAVKIASFTPSNTQRRSITDYRNNEQFIGEINILGYRAFVQRSITDVGHVIDSATIPQFDLVPVKTVEYAEDGAQNISEAVSITLGEPDPALLSIPAVEIIDRTAQFSRAPKP